MGQSLGQESCCSKSEQLKVEQVEASRPAEAPPAEEAASQASQQAGQAQQADPEPDVENVVEKLSVPRDLTRSEISPELLRGVALQKTLTKQGIIWRYTPSALSLHQRKELYRYSRPVKEVDVFLSHSWKTAGRWKFISLLCQFGWCHMLVAWAAALVISFVLCLLEVLPLNLQVIVTAGEPAYPAGCWILASSWIAALGGLLLSPYLRLCSRSRTCFLDAVCVHQADPVLMQAGIDNICGVLAASKELRVLWSAPYLSRLWCIFELAAYRKLNPSGKIIFAPVFVEASMLQMFMWMYTLSFAYWISRGVLDLRIYWFLSLLLVLAACGYVLVHSLRLGYISKRSLIADLAEFDVHKVECFNESDRISIHSAIVRWYGSLDAFSEYVRGPLREDVLEPVQTPGSLPPQYIWMLAAPVFSVCMEGWVALIRSDLAFQRIFSYFVSYHVGLALLWIPAVLVFITCACERWATSNTRSCKSHLQSLGIVLLATILCMAAAAVALQAYLQGMAFALLWAGISLIFTMFFWRRCRKPEAPN